MAKASTKKKSAKAEAATAKAKAKPTNLTLPGTVKKIADLDRQAAVYVQARDARMELTEEEVKEKEKLHGLMLKHQLRIYRIDDDTVVEIVTVEEKVQVKKMPIDGPKKRKAKDADAEAAAE